MRPGRKSQFEFFLGEIAWPSDEAKGYIVELMRSVGHIKDFQKLFTSLAAPETDDFDEIAHDLQHDSLRILILNFAASQLRESLKLFSKFSKLKCFPGLREQWSEEQRQNAQHLSDVVSQFDSGSGLLYSILKPLRDKTFHYDPIAAQEWVGQRMEQEHEPKPPISRIDLQVLAFGPGTDYDESIYSKHLFWSGEAGSLLAAQTEVWRLQVNLLDFVQALTEGLMKKSNVPGGRAFDWPLKYRYGFKPESNQ